MENFPKRLNWKQACTLLQCSKSHFYNLVNNGDIPAERSGKIRGVSVKLEDCKKFLQQWRDRLEG